MKVKEMVTQYVFSGSQREPTINLIQRIEENEIHNRAYKAFLALQEAERDLCVAIGDATLASDPIKPKIPEGSWYTEHIGWHRVRIKTENDPTHEIGAGLTPKKAALEAWEWLGKPKCGSCGETVVDCECYMDYLVPTGELR